MIGLSEEEGISLIHAPYKSDGESFPHVMIHMITPSTPAGSISARAIA